MTKVNVGNYTEIQKELRVLLVNSRVMNETALHANVHILDEVYNQIVKAMWPPGMRGDPINIEGPDVRIRWNIVGQWYD